MNHKDENKLNNHVDNLEWCTASYNTNYGTAIKRAVEKKSIIINQYDKNGNYLNTYLSFMDAQRKTGIFNNNIVSSRCSRILEVRAKRCRRGSK